MAEWHSLIELQNQNPTKNLQERTWGNAKWEDVAAKTTEQWNFVPEPTFKSENLTVCNPIAIFFRSVVGKRAVMCVLNHYGGFSRNLSERQKNPWQWISSMLKEALFVNLMYENAMSSKADAENDAGN